MNNLKVVNRSIKAQCPDAHIINIMRPNVLGNPFVIGKDGNRTEVIEKYRHLLWSKIKAKDSGIIEELSKIKELTLTGSTVYLMCCCKPAPCHGDVIKSCVEWCISKSK